MTKHKYPLDRLTTLAKAILSQAEADSRVAQLVTDNVIHDESYLREFCRRNGILIVHEQLPGSFVGAVTEVLGDPVIVLDTDKSVEEERAFILGHEVAHVVLGHLDHTRIFQCGYGSAIDGMDRLLRMYTSEQELSASLLSMAMILPDGVLHKLGAQYAFLPTRSLAKRWRFPTPFVAARVELYRRIHGYGQTDRRLRNKNERQASIEIARRLELSVAALQRFLLV